MYSVGSDAVDYYDKLGPKTVPYEYDLTTQSFNSLKKKKNSPRLLPPPESFQRRSQHQNFSAYQQTLSQLKLRQQESNQYLSLPSRKKSSKFNAYLSGQKSRLLYKSLPYKYNSNIYNVFNQINSKNTSRLSEFPSNNFQMSKESIGSPFGTVGKRKSNKSNVNLRDPQREVLPFIETRHKPMSALNTLEKQYPDSVHRIKRSTKKKEQLVYGKVQPPITRSKPSSGNDACLSRGSNPDLNKKDRGGLRMSESELLKQKLLPLFSKKMTFRAKNTVSPEPIPLPKRLLEIGAPSSNYTPLLPFSGMPKALIFAHMALIDNSRPPDATSPSKTLVTIHKEDFLMTIDFRGFQMDNLEIKVNKKMVLLEALQKDAPEFAWTKLTDFNNLFREFYPIDDENSSPFKFGAPCHVKLTFAQHIIKLPENFSGDGLFIVYDIRTGHVIISGKVEPDEKMTRKADKSINSLSRKNLIATERKLMDIVAKGNQPPKSLVQTLMPKKISTSEGEGGKKVIRGSSTPSPQEAEEKPSSSKSNKDLFLKALETFTGPSHRVNELMEKSDELHEFSTGLRRNRSQSSSNVQAAQPCSSKSILKKTPSSVPNITSDTEEEDGIEKPESNPPINGQDSPGRKSRSVHFNLNRTKVFWDESQAQQHLLNNNQAFSEIAEPEPSSREFSPNDVASSDEENVRENAIDIGQPNLSESSGEKDLALIKKRLRKFKKETQSSSKSSSKKVRVLKDVSLNLEEEDKSEEAETKERISSSQVEPTTTEEGEDLGQLLSPSKQNEKMTIKELEEIATLLLEMETALNDDEQK